MACQRIGNIGRDRNVPVILKIYRRREQMAVVLRLKRMGAKKNPFYRIVAVNKSDKRDGKVVDEIGHYDPMKKDDNVSLKKERIEYWLKNGAKPSGTVRSIIKKAGII